jgi:hypothetical protein
MNEIEIIHVRVGTTRSGKIIPYSSSIQNFDFLVKYFENNFSVDDVLDAFAVFEYLALRSVRRQDKAAKFDRHAIAIQSIFDPQELFNARQRANIKSAFDLRDLGKSLVALEFTNF